MAELEFFLACESLSVDQQTNKLSLFNILEEGRVDQEGDGGFFRVALASLWRFDKDELGETFEIQVIVEQPNGEEIETPVMEFQPEQRTHRVFTRMSGLPLAGIGELEFNLFLNGDLQDTYRISVKTAQQEETVREDIEEEEVDEG